MDLLFLNALKGLKNHKIQMLSIIFLIFLSTGIYTMMNTSLDRIENRYYDYLQEQNVEDFSFTINVNYEKDFTKDKVLSYLDNELSSINYEDKSYIYTYALCLNSKTEICNEYLYHKVDSIFKNYGILDKINIDKVNYLSNKYDFTYEETISKTYISNGISTKLIPYQSNNKLNIPYLLEGSFPKNNNEITILKGYAKKNNINIGDSFSLGEEKYLVVGFAYASDYVYPMISINIPIFDESKNNIIFMTYESFDKFNTSKEVVYSAKFNYKTNPKVRMEIELIEDKEGNLIPTSNNPATDIFVNEKNIVTRDIETISRSLRIDMMQLEFDTSRLFAEYFLYLLLSISVIIIIIINKKRIEDERLQIGVLKSLGYKKIAIAISYLVYPIIGSLIGGILGYFIGYFSNDFLTNLYLSYFNVTLISSSINITYLYQCIFIPMVSLSILAFIISLLMLNKKPLELLREGSNLKINKFTKIIGKITKKFKFDNRFKYSLASRSLSKLLIVSITSFAAGLLITLTLIGGNLFNNLIDESLSGYNFSYMITYNNVLKDIDDNDDYVLQTSSKIVSILDKNNNEKKLDDESYNITLSGVDSNLKFFDIKDKKDKNLLNNLADRTIIINYNVKDLLDVSVGDYLVLEINNKNVSYEIIGIEDNYINQTGYVKRSDLSKDLGFDYDIYNFKYSNNKKYDDITKLNKNETDNIYMIFSLNDLKDNINSQMKIYNESLYIVVLFAALISLVIITVIANIIVEENKKTISLMKVMGYYDKRISKIVLNIYTPFIIFFYLLSVPIMKRLLELIVGVLADDMEMTIPITISFGQILIGLISLLISYYIAISLSKKTLNKIPLSIALKRE